MNPRLSKNTCLQSEILFEGQKQNLSVLQVPTFPDSREVKPPEQGL